MSVGFALPTESLQRCRRLHINCIEFGRTWTSIALGCISLKSMKWRLHFQFGLFSPKAPQRCPHSHPSEQNCIVVESQTLLLFASTCCQAAAVGNALLNSSLLYSPFSKSLPFSYYFLFLRSITHEDHKTNHKK